QSQREWIGHRRERHATSVHRSGEVCASPESLGSRASRNAGSLQDRDTVQNPISAAENRLRVDLVSEAEARSPVVEVCRSLAPVVRCGELHRAVQIGETRNLAGERRRRIIVEVAQPVVPLCMREVGVPAKTEINGKPLAHLEIVLNIQTVVAARGGRREGMLLVAAGRKPQQKGREAEADGAYRAGARVRLKERVAEGEATVRLPELCEVHEQLVVLESGLDCVPGKNLGHV